MHAYFLSGSGCWWTSNRTKGWKYDKKVCLSHLKKEINEFSTNGNHSSLVVAVIVNIPLKIKTGIFENTLRLKTERGNFIFNIDSSHLPAEETEKYHSLSSETEEVSSSLFSQRNVGKRKMKFALIRLTRVDDCNSEEKVFIDLIDFIG